MVNDQPSRDRPERHFVGKSMGRNALSGEENAVAMLGLGSYPRPTLVYAHDLAVLGKAFNGERHQYLGKYAPESGGGGLLTANVALAPLVVHVGHIHGVAG